jgi:RNA polymerase sigma-70 factor (ECF subfamily)
MADAKEMQEIVIKARSGDTAAFCELVTHYGPAIRSLCLMRAVEANRADDIAQQVFLLAWKRLPELNEPAAFWSWLETITRNHLLTEWRRAERERRMHQRYSSACLAKAEIDAETNLENAEELSRHVDSLKKCLDSLPAELRKMVKMRYDENKTSQEISTILGRSADAVRQTMFRLREKLKDCIERRMGSERKSPA